MTKPRHGSPPEVTGPVPGGGRAPWLWMNAGFQFAVTVGLFAGLGHWLDRAHGWSPWGTVVASLVGVAAATYHLLRQVV